MTKEEAIEILRGILTEATEFSNSVCYVTEEDREPLEMAIKALEQDPCDEAVSRQAVLDGLASIAKARAKSDAQKSLMGRVMFFTEHLPPVTPQPKTGYWEQYGDPWEDKFKCSECGKEQPKILCGEQIIGHWSDYCPNCGCRMVEPQESEDKK